MSCLPRSLCTTASAAACWFWRRSIVCFELSKLGPNVLFQASEAVLLRGIVHRQSLQPLEARPNFPYRRVVRIEATVLASEQIATLAGFGIFHRGKARALMRSTCHRVDD